MDLSEIKMVNVTLQAASAERKAAAPVQLAIRNFNFYYGKFHALKNVNMDTEGVVPDVTLDTPPDLLAKGIDLQLEKAVEVLQADVIAAKKKAEPPPVAVKPEEAKAVTPKKE